LGDRLIRDIPAEIYYSMVDSTDSSNNSSKDLGTVFDEHVRHEFEDHDVEATMKTMVREPYVHQVPTLTGGVGYNGVYNFYKNHFIGKTPSDTNITHISRTVGKDQVVDELIVSFTHNMEVDFILPGIPQGSCPTSYAILTKLEKLPCYVYHFFYISSNLPKAIAKYNMV
jgi:hypothetical protein